MTATFFDHLSRDFTELLNDKEDCNVSIEVGENPQKRTFLAHSAVLRYRSSYFRRELRNDRRNIKRITKENISARIFNIILRYIYGGFVKFDDIETPALFDLMIKSNELEFEEMASYLETYLLANELDWLRNNFSTVCNNVYNQHELKKLRKFCNEFIIRCPDLIFDSDDFNDLYESSLVSLLKRDDLQIEEGKIWDKVIQWGYAHTPNLPGNLKDWTRKDFNALKSTLQQCLPHIRYFQLTVEDIFDKIAPYKKVLERSVWRDLTVHLADPDRRIETIMLPPRKGSKPQTSQSSSQSHASQFSQSCASSSQANTPKSYTPQFPQTYASQSLSQISTSSSYASQSYIPKSFTSQSYGYQQSSSRSPSTHSYASQSFTSPSSATKLHVSQSSTSRSSSTHPNVLQSPSPRSSSTHLYTSQPISSQSPASNLYASQPISSQSPASQLFTKVEPAEEQEEQLSLEEEKSSEGEMFREEEGLSEEEVFGEELSEEELFKEEKLSKEETLGEKELSEEELFREENSSEDEMLGEESPSKARLPAKGKLPEPEEQLIIFEDPPIQEKEQPSNIIHETKLFEHTMGPFSTVITEDHVLEISSWIDRKENPYDSTSNPYEFKLLVRGSRDGFDPRIFWETCDGHAETVVVMKVKDTDEILGGYNPIAWDKDSPNRRIKTLDSFIFSLRNGNVSNSILSRVKRDDVALWYYPQHVEGGYGPWFGNGNLGMKTGCSDFTKDAKCSANPYSKWYETPIRTSEDWFSIDEYEVFSVSKKERFENFEGSINMGA